ncbi:LTA synthase family protein [Arcanobacterium wilhelmae]|uniref:LTA synthase family protein n=1 Tax=Arcanobacterium wilhelmae TaxID=1803177 RepID=UPI003BF78D34
MLSILILIGFAFLTFGVNKAAVARGAAVGLFANAGAFIGVVYGTRHKFLYGATASPKFMVLFLGVTLVAGFAMLFLLSLAHRDVLERKEKPWTWRQLLPILGGAFLGLLIGAIFFITKTVADSVDTVSADQILFILTQGNGETTVEQTLEFYNYMVAPIIWIGLVGAGVGTIRSDFVWKRGEETPEADGPTSHDDPGTLDQGTPAPVTRAVAPTSPKAFRFPFVRGAAMVAMVGMLGASMGYAAQRLPLGDLVKVYFENSTVVQDNFVMPTDDKIHLPEKKRNLIHIYMESIENSFYSRDMGGYLDHDVMPELAALTKEGVSFSHTDKYGGPQQLYATGHSVAAMISMQAGVPMLASGAGNGKQMSFPDFPTIGDFLSKAGYATDFMVGSDSRWAGLGDYYRRHGNFEVHDLTTFKDQKKIPRNYKVWWGVEDDKLYEYAKELMTKRGSEGKPFYFILENADTHFPNGYPSPRMTEKPFATQYENVIHYSQRETVKLVRWIQSQPWAKDTTIVITGDHRSMDKNFFKKWDKSYNRTVVNMILNPVQGTDLPKSITNNRQYAPFDLFPTILASIGAKIDGDRLGMGVNLYSGKKTLVDEKGVEFLNSELAKRSDFYDQHRETKAATFDRNQDNKF